MPLLPSPARTPLRRPCLVAGAVTLLLSAGADAVAAEPLPVGAARGVRIERDRGELVVVFTRRALQRRLAGKRVRLECTSEPDEERKGATITDSSESTYRVPRARQALRTAYGADGVDYCRLFQARQVVRRGGKRVRLQEELIASVPLSQAGAVVLDEEERGYGAFGILLLAGELADRRTPSAYPTPARLIAWADARARGRRHGLVALGSPADTPPPGDYGYYSDGSDHAAAVTLSSSGRRLFFEILVDDEIRTNMPWILSFELR